MMLEAKDHSEHRVHPSVAALLAPVDFVVKVLASVTTVQRIQIDQAVANHDHVDLQAIVRFRAVIVNY